jgi:hypothetical protein
MISLVVIFRTRPMASGRFMVRMPPELHEQLANAPAAQNTAERGMPPVLSSLLKAGWFKLPEITKVPAILGQPLVTALSTVHSFG